MRDLIERIGPLLLVLLVTVGVLVLVHWLLEPRIAANEQAAMDQLVNRIAGDKRIGPPQPGGTGSVREIRPVYGGADELLGTIAVVETSGYNAALTTVVGTGVDGETWGLGVLDAAEDERVNRRLRNADTLSAVARDEPDALSGATVTRRGLDDGIRAARRASQAYVRGAGASQ